MSVRHLELRLSTGGDGETSGEAAGEAAAGNTGETQTAAAATTTTEAATTTATQAATGDNGSNPLPTVIMTRRE